MSSANMPADWTPPADAWIGARDPSAVAVVMAVFGVQSGEDDAGAALRAWFAEASPAAAEAPFEVVHGRFTDGAGLANRLLIAYWPEAVFRRWWALPGVAASWAGHARRNTGRGWWREVLTMPPTRRETLFSSRHAEGVAHLAPGFEGPVREHGYWGSARDRIPASDTDPLAGIASPPALRVEGGQARVDGLAGLCVIRSGQDWSACEGAERAYYLGSIKPVLEQGMSYLVGHPSESGCLCCRMVTQTDASGADMEKSFALAYFAELSALEGWARDHATHHAIFGGFLEMVERFGGVLALRLWHEVFVLDESPTEAEYIGCHAATGLLRAATAE